MRKLLNYYGGYKRERATNEWLAYADIVPLKKGNQGFNTGFDIDNFQVIIDYSHYVVPANLKKHKEEAIKLFKAIPKLRKDPKTNDWENELSARIQSFETDKALIKIQPAYYFEQIGSNLTIDWASKQFPPGYSKNIATIHNFIEPPINGYLPKLNESMLANTLGVAAMVYTNDQKMLIPIRGDNQAVMSGTGGKFHCSASGVFNWEVIGKYTFEQTFEIFVKGMRKEIETEINLVPSDYELFPLIFARELPRAGKPQLFFGVKTKLNLDCVYEKMKNAKESWEFISDEELPKKSPLKKWLDAPSEIDNDLNEIEKCFTYEGWAAFKFMMAYLSNQIVF